MTMRVSSELFTYRHSFTLSILLAIVVATLPTAVPAHHNSGAQFETSKEVTLEGVVTGYEWTNPHVYLFVEAEDAGTSTIWEIEAGPVALMKRLGWSRQTLAIGDRLAVTANPGKNPDKHELLLVSAQKADTPLPLTRGDAAFKAFSVNDAPQQTNELSGTWVTLLDEEVLSSFEQPPPSQLTEKGATELENFDEKTMHPGIECIPATAPLLMLIPDIKSLEIGEQRAWIRGEFDGVERLVHIGSIDAESEPTLQGHSIGEWQGADFIVTTTQFTDHRMGNGFGVPSGPQKKLFERFTLNPDKTSLTYHFELSDPEYLATSISGEVRWAYRPDFQFVLRECDPENARRFVRND